MTSAVRVVPAPAPAPAAGAADATLAGATRQAPGSPGLPDPEHRGRTVIAGRVVEQVAAQAATEAGGVGSAGTQVLGRTVRSADPDARPQVTARVDGHVAHLQLTLSLPWGVSAAERLDAVRARVTDQVARLADVRVTGIDVHVTAFHTGAPRARVL